MNHTMAMRPSLSEKRLAGERAAFHRVGLKAVEGSLAQARAHAELIGEPVLAYFIEMAIAEVERKSEIMQDDVRTRHAGATDKVMQFTD